MTISLSVLCTAVHQNERQLSPFTSPSSNIDTAGGQHVKSSYSLYHMSAGNGRNGRLFVRECSPSRHPVHLPRDITIIRQSNAYFLDVQIEDIIYNYIHEMCRVYLLEIYLSTDWHVMRLCLLGGGRHSK